MISYFVMRRPKLHVGRSRLYIDHLFDSDREGEMVAWG